MISPLLNCAVFIHKVEHEQQTITLWQINQIIAGEIRSWYIK